MKWSEVLYTIKDQGVIKDFEYQDFLTIPQIKDEIFLPDYEKLGYQSVIPNVKVYSGIISIEMSLISVEINRRLDLDFGQAFEVSENRGFVDSIHLIVGNDDKYNTIFIDILAEKTTGHILHPEYSRLKHYQGSFTDKCRACLTAIKSNYDTYARDIIEGKTWNNDAWKDFRDEY